MRILVAGGLAFKNNPGAKSFCRALGTEIVSRGHVLLTGNRSKLDRQVMAGAAEAAKEKAVDLEEVIISWILQKAKGKSDLGHVLRSGREDWSLDGKLKPPPEPIDQADVAVFVGGGQGTRLAGNWATVTATPIVPVAAFGGVAAEIFREEQERLARRRRFHVDPLEFARLDPVTADQAKYAADVVDVALKMVASNEAFVIMSFDRTHELDDLYDAYKTVAGEFGFKCNRVDDKSDVESITAEIFRGIRRSAFVFADISAVEVDAGGGPPVFKPNVFYETGYARALGKDVIVTAREGTDLPFDVHDVPTVFWKGQKKLKDDLRLKVARIADKLGRVAESTAEARDR